MYGIQVYIISKVIQIDSLVMSKMFDLIHPSLCLNVPKVFEVLRDR